MRGGVSVGGGALHNDLLHLTEFYFPWFLWVMIPTRVLTVRNSCNPDPIWFKTFLRIDTRSMDGFSGFTETFSSWSSTYGFLPFSLSKIFVKIWNNSFKFHVLDTFNNSYLRIRFRFVGSQLQVWFSVGPGELGQF